MPPGRSSWLVRSIGLGLARRNLRRTLEAARSEARTPLAGVLARPPAEPSSVVLAARRGGRGSAR
jgi:hypothetical protein